MRATSWPSDRLQSGSTPKDGPWPDAHIEGSLPRHVPAPYSVGHSVGPLRSDPSRERRAARPNLSDRFRVPARAAVRGACQIMSAQPTRRWTKKEGDARTRVRATRSGVRWWRKRFERSRRRSRQPAGPSRPGRTTGPRRAPSARCRRRRLSPAGTRSTPEFRPRCRRSGGQHKDAAHADRAHRAGAAPVAEAPPVADQLRGGQIGLQARSRGGGHGAHVHFQDLRHSCATILLGLGVPLNVIKDILGHTSMKTTERYAHALVRQQRDALSKLGPLHTALHKRQPKKPAKPSANSRSALESTT